MYPRSHPCITFNLYPVELSLATVSCQGHRIVLDVPEAAGVVNPNGILVGDSKIGYEIHVMNIVPRGLAYYLFPGALQL